MILLQYLLQTGFVVVIALFFIPIIHEIFFESGYVFQTAFLSTLVDELWNWSIIFFIGAMAGNTLWFIRALQAYQRTVRTF